MSVQQHLTAWLRQDGVQSFPDFCINLVIAFLLCTATARLFVRYGHTVSDRSRLARTFVLLGVVTTLVISIVSSSLALSLGLVGALSIVRFRTPIKEPEELVYLFLVIAIGLGLGGGRPFYTLVGFAVAAAVIVLHAWGRKDAPATAPNVLVLESEKLPAAQVSALSATVGKHFPSFSLLRLTEGEAGAELTFLVEAPSLEALVACKQEMEEGFSDVRIGYHHAGAFPS